MKIIDLSVAIENKNMSEEVPAKIHYIGHKKGADLLGLGVLWKGNNLAEKIIHFISGWIGGKRLKNTDFPDRAGLSTEKITLTTHTGTHLDSPFHYGKKNTDFSKIPLETFIGEGVLLDFTNHKSLGAITKEEVKKALEKQGLKLHRGNIVLLRTGADKYYGTKEYKTNYIGLSKEALIYLLQCGVKMIGTDAFGLDQPFDYMYSQYRRTGDNKYLWPVHMYGREHPYIMIEKLNNLGKIGKTTGFWIAAFPIYIKNASAGWARVVAICE